ncbi:MAG: UbiH/UbiF/VisC/COQ6 family ubiquinone biosynthesis hydroxylase [Gammaproteobacteria bacterium]|nr:UbiH/UbiF/VisC/COQ6 family ubiquinone biosynthesis hydroxylase [Gammaproteobacteria bacterium]
MNANKAKIDHNVDVIIVGAGMVGATLACALAPSTLRIALLDARCPQQHWADDGYDLRVSAITRASQSLLQELQIWPYIEAQRLNPNPYREMHVWDASGDGEVHFDSAELGEPDLGHIIENRVIVKALHQRLSKFDNVHLRCPVEMKKLDIGEDRVNLTLADETQIQAKLIIAADGGRSWIRQQAGIGLHGWDYDQSALVTWVKTEAYHQDTAWQRFQPDGPLAFLPLSEGYSSIVWSTSHEHAQALLALDEAAFAEELAASFERRLGKIEKVGPRAVFPLRYFETLHYVQARLALVGDAAHMMHPLAGQGVNLGMADAASLAEVLLEAHGKHRDLGSYKVLRRYERWRRADNRAMLCSMDALKLLFSSRSDSIRWLRNTGLNMTDHIMPLKHAFMQRALGS